MPRGVGHAATGRRSQAHVRRSANLERSFFVGGDAGRLVEEVLANEPANPKALWYGGLVAFEQGREDDVKARWSRLLALNPPPEIATMLRTQLAALGAAPAEPVSGGPGSVAGERVASGPTVQLDVSLAGGLSISSCRRARRYSSWRVRRAAVRLSP
jgi:hypothetical protein